MDQYNYCPHRLPCGICKETGSWCFYSNFKTYSGTDITTQPKTGVSTTIPNLEIRYTTNTEEK